jgi:uncharacterized protein (DUF2164 family)
MIDELGPIVYNKAVADVQSSLQARVMEVDMEVYEDEFQYWGKFEPKKKGK